MVFGGQSNNLRSCYYYLMNIRGMKWGLFHKSLLIFGLISLLPLGVVSWYLVESSQRTLKDSILRDQKSLAIGFADTVYNYVTSFRNVLIDASRRDDFSLMLLSRQKSAINKMMQIHAAFLEMSVIDIAGNETVRVERFREQAQESQLRNFLKDDIFNKALRGGEYIGGMERFMGSYPTIKIGIQLLNPNSNQVVGVLMAKLSLNGLSSILKTGFPESTQTQAAVIDTNGFLIAHSDLNLAFKSEAKLPEDVIKVLLSNDSKSGGNEMRFIDGERALVSFAEVKEMGWIVYIQRAISVAYQTSQEMKRRAWYTMMWVVVFVFFLGWVVSIIIIHPIQVLSEAAVKLGEGQFEDLPEFNMPNDEIGELARTFSQMSDSLRVKTAEIISAKEELERLNRTLENRVEARTRELKAAQDELIKKERLAAIGQMASVVGHEIRNPLAVINNSVYFIKTKLGTNSALDPKIAKHISIVESEIQQANGIINEILGFARSKELNQRNQFLNPFMEDLLSSYPFAPNIKVIKELAAGNPVVNIDSDEMKQALRNLIGNGVEVMPNGGAIKIVAETMRDSVRIDISDSGPGIPKDVIDKIFTPFFTTKARGTGLGLAVVRKVMDRHKGRVEVMSEVGKGTVFKLYLPLGSAVAAPKRDSL